MVPLGFREQEVVTVQFLLAFFGGFVARVFGFGTLMASFAQLLFASLLGLFPGLRYEPNFGFTLFGSEL